MSARGMAGLTMIEAVLARLPRAGRVEVQVTEDGVMLSCSDFQPLETLGGLLLAQEMTPPEREADAVAEARALLDVFSAFPQRDYLGTFADELRRGLSSGRRGP